MKYTGFKMKKILHILFCSFCRKKLIINIIICTTIHYWIIGIIIGFKNFKKLRANPKVMNEMAEVFIARHDRYESDLLGVLLAWYLSYGIIIKVILNSI